MKAPKQLFHQPPKFMSALIRSGYFPEELPPAITTRYFAQFCETEYSFLNSQKGALLKTNTQYEVFSAPRQISTRRNFAVVHPLGQLAVSLAITHHRAEIRKIINGSKTTLYRTNEDMAKQRVFRGLDFRQWEKQRAKIQSEYPFILNADISRFFHTIYTHSIPWAAIGKSRAKNWFLNNKAKFNAHWSNDLDKALQSCQSRETFGIPVGPDTSRIVAEILMAGVERDEGFSHWLERRLALRLVDDLTIGFMAESDAMKALASLRTTLWKYNLQLNDEKTAIVPSRTPLRSKWELDHDKFSLSGSSSARHSADISRLLDLTLHLCADFKTDAPAILTCQRLARLPYRKDTFLLILDTFFRLAREFPRCTSHVATYLINNKGQCQQTPFKERISQWIRQSLTTHSTHGNDFEVGWGLVVCGALKIQVRKADLKSEGPLPNSIVMALLGLLHEKKLLNVPLANWPWRAEFKKNGIRSHNWLPFYEAVRRKWTKDKVLIKAVMAEPILAKMIQKKVTFLERRILDAKSIDLSSRVFKPAKGIDKKPKITPKGKATPKKSPIVKLKFLSLNLGYES